MTISEKALIYACSGCSNVGQLANAIAIDLHREGLGEMGCIAGVGGDIPSHIKLVSSGRPILSIDGCPMECVRRCLARHGITPQHHITLSDLGIQKNKTAPFSENEKTSLVNHLKKELVNSAASAPPEL
jgi:uncharacterized metal-binding protein